MENMDKGLTVPKCVLIVQSKIPQIPQKFICPRPEILDFNEKRLHWASVVRGAYPLSKGRSIKHQHHYDSEFINANQFKF